MIGSIKQNNNAILKNWHYLFTSKILDRSVEAKKHWKLVEHLSSSNYKHKNWKNIPLEEILDHDFIYPAINYLSIDDCDILSLKLTNACRLVFIDGYIISSLSDDDTGLWIIQTEKGSIRKKIPSPIQPDIFSHLTESLNQEITRIYLPMGKKEERQLYMLHINHGNKNENILNNTYYRHHIDIGKGAYGQIIEHFVSLNNSQKHLSNARTSIEVGDNAQLNYTKLVFENHNSYHFGHNDIKIGQNNKVHSSTFILGTKLTLHQTSVQLNETKSDLAINSLSMPSNINVNDIRTYLEHNKSYCISRQLHKIIACDNGKGIFRGLIKVAKNAIKTDSKMTNNNLLLDISAEINTKPYLEIYADDVKCSHGSTTGKINENQIFYLRSRGISRKIAQQMIISAFAEEVIEIISCNTIRNILIKRISNILEEIKI